MTDRQSALQESVLLLSPTLSFWRGSYQLSRSKTDVVVEGEKVAAKSVTTPHAVLLSDAAPLDRTGQPWKKRLQAIEAQHNRTIERYSVPFPIRGVRIVPKTRGGSFFDELFGQTLGNLRQEYEKVSRESGSGCHTAQVLRQRIENITRGRELPDHTPVEDPARETQSVAYLLHAAAEEFCDDLDGILQQIARATDSHVWLDVQNKVPQKRKLMREKFNLDVVPMEIAGGGTDINTLTRADLSAHAAIVRAACQRKVNEAVEAMVAEPRKQLAEAVGNLQELVTRGGRVTAKSFNPLQAAIEKIRAFAFVADNQLLATIDQLEKQLGATQASSLNENTFVSSGLSSLLSTVSETVSDAAKQSADILRFGRGRRRVQVI